MAEKNEWVEYFAEHFPDGVLVTIPKGHGDPQSAMPEDTIQILSDRILVERIENDTPEVVVIDFNSGAVIRFLVEDLETGEERAFLTNVDGKRIMFSNRLTDSQREALRSRREGGLYG